MKSMTDYFSDWFDKDGKHNSRSIFTAADMERAFQRGWHSRTDALSGEYRRDQEDLAKYRSEVPGLDAEINRLKAALHQAQHDREGHLLLKDQNTIIAQAEQITRLQQIIVDHAAEMRERSADLNDKIIRRDDRIQELERLGDQQDKQRVTIRHQSHEIGKLHSQIDRLKAERDDWHLAYDKLISDVVHGRRAEEMSRGMPDYGRGEPMTDQMEARDTCAAEPGPASTHGGTVGKQSLKVIGWDLSDGKDYHSTATWEGGELVHVTFDFKV